MKLDSQTHPLRREYYTKLGQEVWMDQDEVSSEWSRLFETATELGRFEYQWLEIDGKTAMIEKKLRTGQLKLGESGDILNRKLRLMSEEMLAKTWGKEVDEKYKHLKPTGYEGSG